MSTMHFWVCRKRSMDDITDRLFPPTGADAVLEEYLETPSETGERFRMTNTAMAAKKIKEDGDKNTGSDRKHL